jgi:hypothetical protein
MADVSSSLSSQMTSSMRMFNRLSSADMKSGPLKRKNGAPYNLADMTMVAQA